MTPRSEAGGPVTAQGGTTVIPRLADLGADLLVTTRRRITALCLPYAGVAAFALAATLGCWCTR